MCMPHLPMLCAHRSQPTCLKPPLSSSPDALPSQFINYDVIYGTGGTLCYRVEPCVRMLAIQNTCGPSCCRDGAEGDAAFDLAGRSHNYASNNGPGPWVVAVLDQFDNGRSINYGAGEYDVYPCPLTNNLDPTNPNTCNPATCTAQVTATGAYAGETYGCYRCDEVARVGYVHTKCTDDPTQHLRLNVYDTKQRWETDSYAACFYLSEVVVHLPSVAHPPPIPSPCVAPPAPPADTTFDPRPMCGERFYQFINYNAQYGSGGTLCYRVELCVAVLAIQNPPQGDAVCTSGPVSDAAFSAVHDYADPRHSVNEISTNEWQITHGLETTNSHNDLSDNGPGPWLIARLERITYDAGRDEYVNYGSGLHDVYPCPMHPAARDLAKPLAGPGGWSSSYTCNPATCSSAPLYPGRQFGCFNCDTHARVGYVYVRPTTDIGQDGAANVYDTRQRWETQSYAACFYLSEVYKYVGQPPCSPPPSPSPPSPPPPSPPPSLPPPPSCASRGGVVDPNTLCNIGLKSYQVRTERKL